MKSLTILTLFVIVFETFAFIGPSFNINNNQHHDSYETQLSFGPRFKFEKEHEHQEPKRPKYREGERKIEEDDEVHYKAPKNNKLQSCPAELKFETCENECKGNENCPRSKVCCRHSCGTSCVNPYKETEKKEYETTTKTTTKTTKEMLTENVKVHENEKKIKLPTCPGGLKFESCEKECKRNEHCPKTHVCCRFSCGTACIELPKEDYEKTKEPTGEQYEDRENSKNQYFDNKKQYQEQSEEEVIVELECPKLRNNVTCENVREICKSDSDCSYSQKCCRVRCSLRCVGPKGSKEARKNEDDYDRSEENVDKRHGRKQANEKRKKNRVNSFLDESRKSGFESLSMPLQNSLSLFNPFLMQNYQQKQLMPGAYQLSSGLF